MTGSVEVTQWCTFAVGVHRGISLVHCKVLQQKCRVPYIHLVGKAIMHNKAMSHLNPVGLHGVSCPVIVVPNLRIIEIGHLTDKT